jgi:hypothetical protein
MIKISTAQDVFYVYRETHMGWTISKNRYENVYGDHLKKFSPTKQDCLKVVLDKVGIENVKNVSISNEKFI